MPFSRKVRKPRVGEESLTTRERKIELTIGGSACWKKGVSSQKKLRTRLKIGYKGRDSIGVREREVAGESGKQTLTNVARVPFAGEV